MISSKFVKGFLFLLIALFLFSCAGSGEINRYNRNVRYFFSSIRNIDKKIVTLSDGTMWKTNRFLIAVNLSDVMVVLEESVPAGYLYINNSKYNVSLLEGSFKINYGYLDQLTRVDTSENTFSLSNGTGWLTTAENIRMINEWQSIPEVVVSLDKTTIINPRKMEFAKIVEITKLDSSKGK